MKTTSHHSFDILLFKWSYITGFVSSTIFRSHKLLVFMTNSIWCTSLSFLPVCIQAIQSHKSAGNVINTDVMLCTVTRVTREDRREKGDVLVGHICKGVWFAASEGFIYMNSLRKLFTVPSGVSSTGCPRQMEGTARRSGSLISRSISVKLWEIDTKTTWAVTIRACLSIDVSRKKNHQPEQKWCSVSEIECGERQTSHAYIHVVTAWKINQNEIHQDFTAHRPHYCLSYLSGLAMFLTMHWLLILRLQWIDFQKLLYN